MTDEHRTTDLVAIMASSTRCISGVGPRRDPHHEVRVSRNCVDLNNLRDGTELSMMASWLSPA